MSIVNCTDTKIGGRLLHPKTDLTKVYFRYEFLAQSMR
jgi:hypothetical protein